MDGLEMFSIQFTDVLEKEGLKPIPAKGKKFDPNYHEAMCKRTDENVEDEIVLTEFEKGYTFRERVLRTAKVEINNR
jgi:molecular chaperone GrpE